MIRYTNILYGIRWDSLRILHFYIPIIAVLFLALSCHDDTFDKNKNVIIPENKVRLKLNTNAGDYAIPSVKAAADENNIGTNTWVLVFEGTQKENSIFKEAVKAEQTENGTFVLLSKSSSDSYLLVIANAPAEYYNKAQSELQQFNQPTLTTALNGKTFSETENILYTPLLDQPSVSTVPYRGSPVPMAGIADIPGGIGNGTIISNSNDGKLYLTRIVAKVDVTSTSTNFELSGATIIETPYNSNIFQIGSAIHASGGLTDYLAGGSSELVADIAPAVWDGETQSYTTRLNPIYIYESQAENNTSLIIKGKYKGENYYYKLGFVSESGNVMDIVRNKHYKFEIASITGPGKGTLQEARDGAASNIDYHIVVLDDDSNDIISNGRYYLGVSNSELVIYGEGNQQNILAFTVTTDASAGALTGLNNITSEGSGLNLVSPSNNGSINLATSPSYPGVTEVKISLSTIFEKGEIKIRLGDLTKTVKITRRAPLSYTGVEDIEGNFVSGTIISRGEGQPWLSLSADGVISDDEEVVLNSPGKIYIMATTNISVNGGNDRTGGEFFLARNNEEGRVKYIVSQSCLNTGEIKIDPYGYVGAFWRKNQTGERLIRIPHIDGNEGNWTAMVLEGEDWIKLDTEDSKDPNIGWKSGSNESKVDDMNTASKDATHQVTGDAKLLNGNLKKDGYIYFRIGLKSNYSSTTTNPARYGVILLSYSDNKKFSKIYIRQGEDADYLMRPQDNNSSGTGWGSPARPYAKRFAVYNLTHSTMTGGGNQNHLHPHIDLRTGGFTQYPTQTGAFLQFANSNNQRFAYHPINPTGSISGWQNNYASGFWSTSLIWSHETAPTGWRRPNDGSPSAAVAGSNNISNSEIRQSLYLNPQNGTISNMDNVLYGYYADGFFDRRKVEDSPSGTSSCAVSVNDYHIAYAGYLFFNPHDNRSLFFPLSGRRSNTNGSLQLTGSYASYWSVTTYSEQANAWALTLEKNKVSQNYIIKSEGASIRCIKDE